MAMTVKIAINIHSDVRQDSDFNIAMWHMFCNDIRLLLGHNVGDIALPTEIHQWLVDQRIWAGMDVRVISANEVKTILYFHTPKDAIMFKLRWL
jgi:hypothetical protein